MIKEHFGATSSNLTSPISFQPDFVLSDLMRVIPTSITTAPSLTISPVRNSVIPNAATMISAWTLISFRFLVRLWHKVTVQSIPFCESKMLIGRPTILLRPITTQFLPEVSILYRLINSIIPNGVAEINAGIPATIRPTLTA